MTLKRRISRLEATGGGGGPRSEKGLAVLLAEPAAPVIPAMRRAAWADWHTGRGMLSLLSKAEMVGWLGPEAK